MYEQITMEIKQKGKEKMGVKGSEIPKKYNNPLMKIKKIELLHSSNKKSSK